MPRIIHRKGTRTRCNSADVGKPVHHVLRVTKSTGKAVEIRTPRGWEKVSPRYIIRPNDVIRVVEPKNSKADRLAKTIIGSLFGSIRRKSDDSFRDQ